MPESLCSLVRQRNICAPSTACRMPLSCRELAGFRKISAVADFVWRISPARRRKFPFHSRGNLRYTRHMRGSGGGAA